MATKNAVGLEVEGDVGRGVQWGVWTKSEKGVDRQYRGSS